MNFELKKDMSTINQQIYLSKANALLIVIAGALCIAVVTALTLFTMPMIMTLMLMAVIVGVFVFLLVPERRRVVLALLVFAIPLNIDINIVEKASSGGADGLSFGLVELLMLVLLVITVLRSLHEKQFGALNLFPVLLLPSLAMLLFFAISTINSADLLWSAFDIFNFTKVTLVFLLIANNVRNETDMQIILLALFGGLLVQVFVATVVTINPGMNDIFLQLKLGVTGDIDVADVVRSGGSLGNANHFGRYLGLILPIAYMVVLTRQSRFLVFAAGLVSVIGTLAIINTLSRSAWIGLVCSVLVMLPLMLIHRHVTFRSILLIGAAGLIGVIVMTFYGETIWLRLTQDDHGSAMTRITTAKVAWDIIKDYPFFGCGINNYGAMLADYWIGEDTFTNKAAVHNNYLLYMAEIGCIGFTAVIWWLVAFGTRINKAMKSKNKFYSALAISFMGGYLGMLLMSITDKSYKENFTLLLTVWTLMALTEAIIRCGEKNDHRAITL